MTQMSNKTESMKKVSSEGEWQSKTITLGEIEKVISDHRELLDEMGFLTEPQVISKVVGMNNLLKMLRKLA